MLVRAQHSQSHYFSTTPHTLEIGVYVFFYLIEQHSKFLLHTLQVLYMCTLCDSTNINTIIEFVPHVSGDGFSGGSDLYLQFQDTCTLSLETVHTTFEWNCQMVVVSHIWCGIAAGHLYPDSHFE